MAVRALDQPPRGRRREILDAALELLVERGLAGASIEEIRRRSGASVGSIYHHFGSKEGIAAALFVDALGEYQDGFVAALREHDDARAGVEAVVRHHLRWVAHNPDRARYLLTSRDPRVVLAAERPLREVNGRFFGAVMAWIRPRVEAGELRELPPDVLHALWIGPSQELSRHWLAGRAAGALEEAAPLLAAAAWTVLKR